MDVTEIANDLNEGRNKLVCQFLAKVTAHIRQKEGRMLSQEEITEDLQLHTRFWIDDHGSDELIAFWKEERCMSCLIKTVNNGYTIRMEAQIDG